MVSSLYPRAVEQRGGRRHSRPKESRQRGHDSVQTLGELRHEEGMPSPGPRGWACGPTVG